MRHLSLSAVGAVWKVLKFKETPATRSKHVYVLV